MKVSIATFNVENLITDGKPIYGSYSYSQEQYRQKVSWIKNQLLKINAQVVGFQEIFEEQALRACLKDTQFANWNLVLANPTGAKPVNALLSKYPILSMEVIETIPLEFEFFDESALFNDSTGLPPIVIPIKYFSRSVLKAEIKLNDKVSVLIFVVHLKSKRPILPDGLRMDTASYPEIAKGNIRSLIRRGIEASGIRQILSNEINKDETKPIIILGDLNDNDTAVTNQVILGAPPFYKLPTSEKIERWKHVFQNSRDVQARKSIENFHYTYVHNGHYESLDNIFISNHFAELNSEKIGRIIDVRVYNDHVIDSTVSLDRKPVYVTDHGQVVVNINLFD